MKKYWILATFAVVLAACQESLEDRCEREAREYTRKNCPARIDPFTIMDSMTFERDTRTLHYHYTLTGTADRDSLPQMADAVEALRNELKNSTSMKTYKDNKFRFAYTFRSQRNPKKVLTEVVFTEVDY